MDSEFHMCRLCLDRVDPSAVVILNVEENLVETIFQITTVQVIIDPTHLVFMCEQCQNLLETTIQFRTMCLQNDETFRDLHAKHEESLNVAKDEQESLNREESLNIVKDEYSLGTVKDELDTSRTEFVACKVEDDAQNDDMIQGPEVKKSNETRKKYKPRNAHKTSESRKVQCQTCGAFVHPVHLPKHRLIHDKNRPMFACEQCPKKYTEQRKLKEHITIVHEGHLEHTCDRCGKTFHRWETLRQHYLGEHTDLKKYECKVCGEKFSRSANRNYHYRMNHTVEKPFACSYCDKSFKRSCDLTIHIRKHTGEKPFKCDICQKGFTKSYNVVIHKKSHKTTEMRRDDKLNEEDSEEQTIEFIEDAME